MSKNVTLQDKNGVQLFPATTAEQVSYDGVKNIKQVLAQMKILQLNGMTYSDDIELPIQTSYVEAITYMNGRYYAACYDYGTPGNYVAIYNSDFSLISYTYTDSQYGRSNNIFNDGTYLYIDFNNGYHVSFNTSLNVVKAVSNTSIRNMAYWNDTLYGISFTDTSVVVSVLDTDWTTIKSSFTVSTAKQTLQSSSIIDGILIIPTTYGLFNYIDIESESLIAEIPYYSEKEIENFFKDGDGIKCSGHYYGANGVFNIGALTNGVDDPVLQYPSIDGQIGVYNILNQGMACNVYKVTNGTELGLPQDDGDLIVFKNTRIFVNTSGKYMYAYDGSAWKEFAGTVVATTIDANIGSSQKIYLKKAGPNVYAKAALVVTAGSVIANTSIATLPVAYRPTWDTYVPAVARSSGAWTSSTFVPILINIKANGDIAILGNQSQMDTCITFFFDTSYLI